MRAIAPKTSGLDELPPLEPRETHPDNQRIPPREFAREVFRGMAIVLNSAKLCKPAQFRKVRFGLAFQFYVEVFSLISHDCHQFLNFRKPDNGATLPVSLIYNLRNSFRGFYE
jgi:hypothetical protein